ncbi:MAG: DUF1150 domain-containing protein [Alphaproteobacteria bacterium]|nr:DUF1150 domain-containing protein [Alphaproteobacteria bacterium]MDX5369434.1 DUF1150 domain-containing protein [Alphaproteobacteria bacterium]MDX5464114.1 DUF1150 domain-containing protein [Alphaproteobacteria bacterium]
MIAKRNPGADGAISTEALLALGTPDTVYIREMTAPELDELPEAQALGRAGKLYAIHQADGTRLAIVNDRAAAFVTARQNDMEPVSVH